jgi:hypothetical protein
MTQSFALPFQVQIVENDAVTECFTIGVQGPPAVGALAPQLIVAAVGGTSFIAAPGFLYLLDTTLGGFLITVPVFTIGQQFGVKHVNGSLATFAIVVSAETPASQLLELGPPLNLQSPGSSWTIGGAQSSTGLGALDKGTKLIWQVYSGLPNVLSL